MLRNFPPPGLEATPKAPTPTPKKPTEPQSEPKTGEDRTPKNRLAKEKGGHNRGNNPKKAVNLHNSSSDDGDIDDEEFQDSPRGATARLLGTLTLKQLKDNFLPAKLCKPPKNLKKHLIEAVLDGAKKSAPNGYFFLHKMIKNKKYIGKN